MNATMVRRDPINSSAGNWDARWTLESESTPGLYWEVTERTDTVNGGSYLFCNCPQWTRSISKGGCKHVQRVARHQQLVFIPGTVRVVTDDPPSLTSRGLIADMKTRADIAIVDHPSESRPVRRGDDGTEADRLAAAELLAWDMSPVGVISDEELRAEIKDQLTPSAGDPVGCEQGPNFKSGPDRPYGKPGSYWCERDPHHPGDHAWDHDPGGPVIRWAR